MLITYFLYELQQDWPLTLVMRMASVTIKSTTWFLHRVGLRHGYSIFYPTIGYYPLRQVLILKVQKIKS